MTAREIGAVALNEGGDTASWQRSPADARSRFSPRVVITQTDDEVDSGAYRPPACVYVYGIDALLRLRTAIDEALRNEPGVTS